MDIETLNRLERLTDSIKELSRAYESNLRSARYGVVALKDGYILRDTHNGTTLGTRTSLAQMVVCIKGFGIDTTDVIFQL